MQSNENDNTILDWAQSELFNLQIVVEEARGKIGKEDEQLQNLHRRITAMASDISDAIRKSKTSFVRPFSRKILDDLRILQRDVDQALQKKGRVS